MANRLPSPTANNDDGVSVIFKLLPDSTAMIDLPDDGISPDDRMLNNAEGAVDAALETIFAAPSFDQYSATEIGSALGDSVYAIVVSDKFPGGIFTTDERFDPRFGISRTNAPFTAGDLLPSPNSPAGTWEVIDWPTDGPSFENASGMRVQLETDNIADELSPSNDMDAQPQGSQFRDNEGRLMSDPINPNDNVPQSPGDLMGETPSLWPDADDVFRTIAPTAAQQAANEYNAGEEIKTAVVLAANNVLDEWTGYTGDMRRQAEEALTNWLIERVFDGQYSMTRFQFDPEQLPVDSEMREMALRFIENDLQGGVRGDKIERAKQLFLQRATDPDLTQPGIDVQDFLEDAFKQANVDIPYNRAQRFNPEDQRAIGGSAGGGRMDVRWPRGIDEQELGVVAGNMADDGYDRELYSPLNQAQLPTDPQTLIRLGEVMEEYAETRRDVSADYDGQGWYLRVAGVIYQAVDRQID